MLILENISGFENWLLTHPFVEGLLHHLSLQDEKLSAYEKKIKELEKELAKHQKVPSKPDLGGSSKLDKEKQTSNSSNGSRKRNKKSNLKITREEIIQATGVPSDWVLVSHSSHIIQNVILQADNVRYLLEVWRSPDGKKQMTAQLPGRLQGSHFGPDLRAFILSAYHELGSSQFSLSNFLSNIGVDISDGSINNLLIKKQDVFHQEKESLLQIGKALSPELRTDDTGAKHDYENYFTNCINTDFFTYFQTCKTKSRINFLEILRQDHKVYTLNQSSLDYYKLSNCPKMVFDLFKDLYAEKQTYVFKDQLSLTKYFTDHNITGSTTVRILTEGLLIGTIVEDGFDPKTIIHSDEAGQFTLFVHSLCWKHVEKPLRKLKTYNQLQETQLDEVKEQFWQLYQDLKKYKQNPSPNLVEPLTKQFEHLCEHRKGFFHLNQILDKLLKKKDKLLLVLQRPEASLHNNDSERDIREYVKRRKISGSTKTDLGLKAKDTFLSLKKTCKKLGISFWDYLRDRIHKTNNIPKLANIIEQKINAQSNKWGNA